MAFSRPPQINIRSDVLKQRVEEVTRRTGMSATRFLEEAAIFYTPEPAAVPEGLERRGWLFVAKLPDGEQVTLDDIRASIAADRDGMRE